MTIKGVLLRFLLVYTVSIIAAGLLMSHWGIKGSGVNIAILAGCVAWVCGAFGKKNGRYFSGKEKAAVVLGLIAIDLSLQLLFGAAALSRSPSGVSTDALIFAVGFVGILHAAAIYLFVSVAKRPLIKQGVINGSSTMLSPGKQPRSHPVSLRRVLLAVLACVIVTALLLSQKANLEEYRLYFTDERKPVTFALEELSENWTERTLQERFVGYPILCEAYRGRLPVERACGVDVSSHNGVPALFIAFFFSGGHLDQVSINIPWWSHGTAFKSLVAAFGRPAASEFLPRDGVRLYGWQLASGAALFLNRDRPLNPLSWNAIYWRSASACQKGGCFTANES